MLYEGRSDLQAAPAAVWPLLLDVNQLAALLPGVQEVVQRHYDLNRRDGALRQFLEVALNRVVQPLQEKDRQLPPRPQGQR